MEAGEFGVESPPPPLNRTLDCIYVYINYMRIRGEGGRRPPSPLVRVAGATLISSEEVALSKFIQLLSVISK